MSSSISSLSALSPVGFSETQSQAKTEVKKLRNLLLRKNPGERIDLAARPANYIQRLLKAAYPDDGSLEMEMTHRGFETYLSKNHLPAGELLGQIHDLHLIQVTREALETAEKEGSLPFAEDEPQKIEGGLPSFLASKGVTLDFADRVGEGNFGIVVSADVKGEKRKYVYKTEKRDVSKALTERSSYFWREGDCAAARLYDIAHVSKPLFFVFTTSQEGRPEELHYVPANHVKAFGMNLSPGTRVFLEGQLMERAAGESLNKILLKNATILSPIGGKHFTNIVSGLFNIIQELQSHNLIHRDIKPENIFYNTDTGEVTLVDFGSATKLRKKEKADDGSHLHQPTSRELGGTPKYISPRLLQKKPCGSEVDLFSFAMIVLELINRNDVTSFAQQRFPYAAQGNMRDVLLQTCPPREYLDRFLETISDKKPEALSVSLPTQPSFMSSFLRSNGSADLQPAGVRSRAQSLSSTVSTRNSKTERALNRNP